MKVALLGATGKTGRAVLEGALARGHVVTALVRKPEALAQVSAAPGQLVLVQGDALDPDALSRVVSGQEAVLQCLGVGGKGDGKPNSFVSQATGRLVEAMKAHGVRRLVCMSNVGAGDSWQSLPWLFRRVVLPVFMRWLVAILDDKNRMEPVVMQSGLDWTLVRFPAIVDGPRTGRTRVSFDGRDLGYRISTQDAAAFLLDQLEDRAYVGRAPSVSG